MGATKIGENRLEPYKILTNSEDFVTYQNKIQPVKHFTKKFVMGTFCPGIDEILGWKFNRELGRQETCSPWLSPLWDLTPVTAKQTGKKKGRLLLSIS